MKIIETATLPETLSAFEREAVYNGLDCCVTQEILDEIKPQLDNSSTATYEKSLALQAPILEMTMRGIRVNISHRNVVKNKFTKQRKEILDHFDRILSEGLEMKANYRSSVAMAKLFYDTLGLPAIKKAGGKRTIDRDALEKLSINFWAQPLCLHLLALRDLDKRIDFLSKPLDADERWRSSYNIAGTKTGRLSSAESEFGNASNSQNIDRSLRSVFVPDEGHTFINIDLEQGDSRNLGALCWDILGDPSYLDACESGDLHTEVALMTWKELTSAEDAKQIFYRQDSYRQTAKKLGHGCLTPDHEVLTPEGWVPITEKPSVIRTWSLAYGMDWDTVTAWTDYIHEGPLYECSGAISLLMTPDHRVPHFKNGILSISQAEQQPKGIFPLGNNEFTEDVAFAHHPPTEARVLCPAVPSTFFYVRRQGKTCLTGNSNFCGTARTMAYHTKTHYKIIEEFQKRYFTAFPCIPAYHEWVRNQLRDYSHLTTLYGRKRTFFGRASDPKTIRDAVAYSPQSMTADAINHAMLQIYAHLPEAQILAQVHDSLLLQVPSTRVDELVPQILELSASKLTLRGDREFIIPREAKTGYNWGDYDRTTNPRGLMNWPEYEERPKKLSIAVQ